MSRVALSLPAQALVYARKSLPRRISRPQGWDTEESCFARVEELAAALARLRGEAETPAASVIIPLHVREPMPRLARNLAALGANRGAPPTECILILNGKATLRQLEESSMHAFCLALGVRVDLISYLDDPRYRNLGRPRNIFVPKQRGVNLAKGRYLLHADVDCVPSPDWIAGYVRCFEERPELLAAYGPVHYDATGGTRLGKALTVVSTLAKAAKIALGFPPFAGHNHAMRLEARDVLPDMYETLDRNCQLLAGRLHKARGSGRLADTVALAPDALLATIFPKRDVRWGKALEWCREGIVRNVRNYLTHRGSLR